MSNATSGSVWVLFSVGKSGKFRALMSIHKTEKSANEAAKGYECPLVEKWGLWK